MTLVKIGERYINVDTVIEVTRNGDGNLFLVTPPRSNGSQGILLEGVEKEQFQGWLDHNAEDLTKQKA